MFFTNPLLIRVMKFGRPGGGPDKFWKVQQYLRLSWNFTGRKQNCYRIGARYVNKALMYSTIGRKEKKKMMKDLWDYRIDAATHEHDMHRLDFMEGLSRCDIRLDRKVLNDLAIYEPRTFQSLTDVAKHKLDEDGVAPGHYFEKQFKKIF